MDISSQSLTHTAKWVCINGQIVAKGQARISPFDRGFVFADGVYEGVSYAYGKMIDNAEHFARLRRSLAGVHITCPWSDDEIEKMQMALLDRNQTDEGFCYYQITRGVADREFHWQPDLHANLFMFLRPCKLISHPLAKTGVSVVTVDDLRWKRRSIKTIAILPQVLAKQQAHNQGAFEAWMVEDGMVNEGASTSAWIVDNNGDIVIPPLSERILPGVTRAAVLRLAQQAGMKIQQRHFSPNEAIHAKEAFLTSASLLVMPIVSIDGHVIGKGLPGKMTMQLREQYIRNYCRS